MVSVSADWKKKKIEVQPICLFTYSWEPHADCFIPHTNTKMWYSYFMSSVAAIDAENFIYSWQHLSFILNQFTFFVSFKSLKVSELNLHEETKSMNLVYLWLRLTSCKSTNKCLSSLKLFSFWSYIDMCQFMYSLPRYNKPYTVCRPAHKTHTHLVRLLIHRYFTVSHNNHGSHGSPRSQASVHLCACCHAH